MAWAGCCTFQLFDKDNSQTQADTPHDVLDLKWGVDLGPLGDWGAGSQAFYCAGGWDTKVGNGVVVCNQPRAPGARKPAPSSFPVEK